MTVGPRRRPSQDMLNDIDDTLLRRGSLTEVAP